MPTDGAERAGSLKRLLVVAFAPRQRQCDVRCAVSFVLLYCNFATCIDTLGLERRDMQPFEYRSVRYWFKEIDTTLTGGQKKYFF